MNNLQNKIETILQTLIQNNQVFTAYDVTLALRANKEWVLHKNVKDTVHEIMEDEYSYDKVSQTINNGVIAVYGGNHAWVYYPSGADFSVYNSDDLQNSWLNGFVDSVDDADSDDCIWDAAGIISSAINVEKSVVDHRNRVLIPTKVCKEMGLIPGQKVIAVLRDGCLMVFNNDETYIGLDGKTNTVHGHNNILISGGNELGSKPGDVFSVYYDNVDGCIRAELN